MIINRIWAMPNKSTFKIKPIKELLDKYVPKQKHKRNNWVDPFSGTSRIADYCNDINPEKKSYTSMEAMQYVRTHNLNSRDGFLIDPPYSLNQMKTLYSDYAMGKGLYCVRPDSMVYWSKFKTLVAERIIPGGFCISFGWNSMGLGINRGFEKIEILLVPHGGSRNDTIVTVEQKIIQPV